MSDAMIITFPGTQGSIVKQSQTESDDTIIIILSGEREAKQHDSENANRKPSDSESVASYTC